MAHPGTDVAQLCLEPGTGIPTTHRDRPAMSKLHSITLNTPRPLPLFLLLDRSASMTANGKIGALNTAVADLIASVQADEVGRAQAFVSVITFGGTAELHTPLQPAADVKYVPLTCDGNTPLGGALRICRELIEDKEVVSGRAYAPTIVLVSDGQPNDADWAAEIDRLHGSERAQKAQRLAMGIGPDADEQVLRRFVGDAEAPVFKAADAAGIADFFRFVTMSVTARSRSHTPDDLASIVVPAPSLDDL